MSGRRFLLRQTLIINLFHGHNGSWSWSQQSLIQGGYTPWTVHWSITLPRNHSWSMNHGDLAHNSMSILNWICPKGFFLNVFLIGIFKNDQYCIMQYFPFKYIYISAHWSYLGSNLWFLCCKARVLTAEIPLNIRGNVSMKITHWVHQDKKMRMV